MGQRRVERAREVTDLQDAQLPQQVSHRPAREPSPSTSRAFARLSRRTALVSLAAAATIFAFDVVAAAGTAGAATAGSTRSCDVTQTKSLVGTAPTNIKFVNNTSGAVKVYWLSYTGKRVYYATIAAGKFIVQPTFKTHPWVVVDSAGTCVGYVIAPRAVFEIGVLRPPAKPHAASPHVKPVPTKHVAPRHVAPRHVAPTPPAIPRARSTSKRSAIATSLVSPRHAFPLSGRTLLNALLALALVLFIIFPAQVFNHTLDENHEEIADILRRRMRFLARLRRPNGVSPRTSARIAFALVVVSGSILGGLNDPAFGFNALGGRTLVAVVLAFLVGVGITGAASATYRCSRGLPLDGHLHALPAGLLIAAGCVLVSRLVHFEPGYLYGVVAGLAFTTKLADKDQGVDVAASTLTTLAIATTAWIAWVPVSASAAHPHADALILIADTFLASIFVGGVVGTVINLLPLRFLPGGTIVDWNRIAWGAIASIALFVLLEVMVFPAHHTGHSRTTPLATTLALFASFAVASLLFRQYFAMRHHATPDEPQPIVGSVEADAITEIEEAAETAPGTPPGAGRSPGP